MRQGRADGKVGPSIAEAFYSFAPRDIQRVIIDGIDFGKRFDQVRRIALVPAKSSPN